METYPEEREHVSELVLSYGGLPIVPRGRQGHEWVLWMPPKREGQLLEFTHLEAERRRAAAAVETEPPPFRVMRIKSLWMLDPRKPKGSWRSSRRRKKPPLDWRAAAAFTTKAEAEQWGREIARGEIPAEMRAAMEGIMSRWLAHDDSSLPQPVNLEALEGSGHTREWASLRFDIPVDGDELPDARMRRARRNTWLVPFSDPRKETAWLRDHPADVSNVIDVCASWWGRMRVALSGHPALDLSDCAGVPGWIRDVEGLLTASLLTAATGGRTEFSDTEPGLGNTISLSLSFAAGVFARSGLNGRLPAPLQHHVVQVQRSLADAFEASDAEQAREYAFAFRISSDRLEAAHDRA